MRLLFITLLFISNIGQASCPDTILRVIYQSSIRIDTQFLSYFLPLIEVESGCNPEAVSPVGAIGLGQLTPIALLDIKQAIEKKEFVKYADKCSNLKFVQMVDPSFNVRASSCYVQLLLNRYSGSYMLALMAYNGGGLQVKRFKQGRKLVSETFNYLLRILYLRERNAR
jgi:soluble lytic murein transglycosylase